MRAEIEFESFGQWLKRRRRLLDLTQEQLGRLAGCSGAAIRKFEAGERKPSQELAGLLADALQIPDTERQTFLRMARGLPPLHAPAAAPAAAGRRVPALVAENLPAPLTSLIDRIRDATFITRLLEDAAVRWITLIGPPGIGKTRLSIQSARQALAHFADGAWFVDLAQVEDASFVLPAVCRALASLGVPAAASLEQLARELHARSLLLVLDNFEHVTDAAVEIAGLLKRSAQVKVLATSRIPLYIYGEHLYRVPPLSIPPQEAARRPASLMDYEAVQLFVMRTRLHQPGLTPTTENAAAIVDICRDLEGIPLALELAAATLQRMSLEELNGLLHRPEGESWLKQVSTPARDLPARQRTLENVVAWSYTLLTPSQQELFSSLSVFVDGFDLEAARSICCDEPLPERAAVRQWLEDLSEHSLLVRESGQGKPRWRMLEIIHEYASLRLSPARRAELEERRAGHYLERLMAFGSADVDERESFLSANVGNLHTSLNWALVAQRARLGYELVIRLEGYWAKFGYDKAGLQFIQRLLAMPGDLPVQARLDLLGMASDLAWQLHDFETGLSYTEQAVQLGRAQGLRSATAVYLNRLGRINLERGLFPEARRVLEECLELARADPQALNPGAPLAQLGELALFEGRREDARAILHEALDLLTDDEPIFQGIARVDLAEAALAENQFAQAQHWLEQSYAYTGAHIRRAIVFLCAAAGYLLLAPPGGRQAAAAARLYGAIDALVERSGVSLSIFYRQLNEQRSRQARQQLGQSAWIEEFESGRKLSRDEALQQARALIAKGEG